ncbi:MAG: hypothetical protein WCT03_00100 [Candidatus Obscuribacterales bacterium]
MIAIILSQQIIVQTILRSLGINVPSALICTVFSGVMPGSRNGYCLDAGFSGIHFVVIAGSLIALSVVGALLTNCHKSSP